MNCKKNLFCFGSADGLNRCTVSWVGLGLLLWTAPGSEVTPLSKVLEAWQTLGSLSRERPGKKKKKECVLCEIYGLQKITAPASVFCYWRHVKAMATKGKFNSLVSKANHCRNPKEVWDTSDMNNIISWLRRRCHGDQHLTDTSVHPELWPWACVRTEKFKFERELYSTQMTGAKRIPNISGLPRNP